MFYLYAGSFYRRNYTYLTSNIESDSVNITVTSDSLCPVRIMAHNSSSEQVAINSDNQDLKGFINKDGIDQRANCYTRPILENVPTKRSTFKITRVINEEGDSMDELDESHTEWTEDYSSEILDNLSRGEETPPISEDIPYLLSRAASKEKSDIHSRFRVVKIETKEPFKRGRWTCHDYLDQLPISVNAEKSETKVYQDDGNSVCSSADSSDNCATGVHVSASVQGCDSVTIQFEGDRPFGLLDGFQPIQPPVNAAVNQSFILNNPLSQVSSLGYASMSSNHCSQISSMGYASDASQRQSNPIVCQINKSMSFQSINSINPIDNSVQQMTYVVPSCPQTREIPPGIIQHGSQVLSGQIDVSTSNIPQVLMPHFSTGHDGQQLPVSFPSSVHMSVDMNPSLIPISNQMLVTSSTFPTSVNLGNHQVPNPVISKSGHCETILATSDINSSKTIVEHSKLDLAVEQATNDPQFNCDKHEDQDHSALPNPETLPPSLVAAVIDLQSPPEDKSGSSSVAIDNKIEQAMDLVKSHLMFAVREEVEVLKEQIAELIERNNQLEYENSILRAAASPETLAKLAMPRQPPSSSS